MIEYKKLPNGKREISLNLVSAKITLMLIAFVICVLGVSGAWR